jgi:hypothetical protein
MRKTMTALLPTLAAATWYLAAVAVRKFMGLDWSHPLPAGLAALAPLAAMLVMAKTRSVPYSGGSLIASGALLAAGLFAAIRLYGQDADVVSTLMSSVLLFSMLGLLPQRRPSWCDTDRGLLFGSLFMTATFVAAGALLA